MNSPTQTPIDFGRVSASVDLQSLIVADLGPPDRSRKWACPFHDDSTPSLALVADGRKWRCFGCGEHGDAVDWLGKREGLSVIEAARRLDPTIPGSGGKPSAARQPTPRFDPKPAAPKPAPLWTLPDWQQAVDELVIQAERILWSSEGREALGWLRRRGLDRDTITRFRLGFLPSGGSTRPAPRRDGSLGPLGHMRGITLPWAGVGSFYGACGEPNVPRWVGLNVRYLAADVDGPRPDGVSKCRAIEGSTRGEMYPYADLIPTLPILPAIITEGEFDSLICTQEAGWLGHVCTVGGAAGNPTDSALAYLACCPWWLICTDYDDAGSKAAWGWSERSPEKARRAFLPDGSKDVNDYFLAGGNVRDWIASEIARLTPSPGS